MTERNAADRRLPVGTCPGATLATSQRTIGVRRCTHTAQQPLGLDAVARLMADAREQLLAEHDIVR